MKLILRPTDATPGLYENEDGPFAVAGHSDGKNYIMIMCDDEASADVDDLVFIGVRLEQWP